MLYGRVCAPRDPCLLEPWYEFRLTVPQECTGRAMTDLQRMNGEIAPPETVGDETLFTGSAPVSELRGYQSEVISYTRGKGRLSCIPKGYFPCHNPEEVIEKIGYDADSDVENSADSVFCRTEQACLFHGTKPRRACTLTAVSDSGKTSGKKSRDRHPQLVNTYKQQVAADKELMEIFERTYGKIKRNERSAMRTEKHVPQPKTPELRQFPKDPNISWSTATTSFSAGKN